MSIPTYKYPFSDFHDLNLDYIIEHFKTFDTSIADLYSKYGALDTRLDTAEHDITVLTDRIRDNEEQDYQLRVRVGRAENNITSLQSRMTAVEGNVTSLLSRMSTAEGRINTISGVVNTLDNKMNTAEDDIDDLQGTVAGLAQDLNTAEQDIDSLEGKVTLIKSRTLQTSNYSTNTDTGISADYSYKVRLIDADIRNTCNVTVYFPAYADYDSISSDFSSYVAVLNGEAVIYCNSIHDNLQIEYTIERT